VIFSHVLYQLSYLGALAQLRIEPQAAPLGRRLLVDAVGIHAD
jgi:hypothetical protein